MMARWVYAGAMSMPQCSIQICVIRMKTDKLCVRSNTIFQIPVLADAPGFSIPVTRPQMSERPRQGFGIPLPGPVCRGLPYP
jgi:hypothetical protein